MEHLIYCASFFVDAIFKDTNHTSGTGGPGIHVDSFLFFIL